MNLLLMQTTWMNCRIVCGRIEEGKIKIAEYLMLYGLIEGEKMRAKPRLKAQCPLCQKALIAKCGAIKVWHWAHEAGNYCDEWGEGETKWHKSWKDWFGVDRVEVVIEKRKKRHIADIVTKKGVVIEVQHSPIAPQIIEAREKFYGRMIWIVDARSFQANLKIRFRPFILKQLKENTSFLWRGKETVIENWVDKDGFEFLTFDCSKLQLKETQKNDLTKIGFFFDRKLGKWKAEHSEKRFRYLHYLQTGLFYTPFEWKWARPSWQFARKPVFLDFHKNYLFYMTEGIGERQGWDTLCQKRGF